MSSIANHFSAANSALGYLYQARLGLLSALKRLKGSSDFVGSLDSHSGDSCERVFQAVEKLAPHFQVTITAHARLNERGYQSTVVGKWRRGMKLVPDNWRQV